ncbi:MAG TPA: hypothetical protein VNI61_03655 [Gemmatimonadales bacterium]|nr:hypothetical protein [Gemmatimonadales bacterium]
MGKRVLLLTRDLFFRSKLAAVVRQAGAEVVSAEAPGDLAVIELGGADTEARLRSLRERGIPVLAFGSHARPQELRAARSAGAVAVPNSLVEARLRDLLEKTEGRDPLRP